MSDVSRPNKTKMTEERLARNGSSQQFEINDQHIQRIQEKFPYDDLHLEDCKPSKIVTANNWKKLAVGSLLLRGLGSRKHGISATKEDLVGGEGGGGGGLGGDGSGVGRGKGNHQDNLSMGNGIQSDGGDCSAGGGDSGGGSLERVFICEGPVKLTTGLQTQDRYLFLFSDLLIVAKERSASQFRLKTKVSVTNIWIANCVDDVSEVAHYPERSFVIGWPTINLVATFKTSEEKEFWLNHIKICLSVEKEKSLPKSVLIRVVNNDPSYTVTKKLCVGPSEEASQIVERCLQEFHESVRDASECQLWVLSSRDDPPYPLIGHEHPYSIFMSHRHQYSGSNKTTNMLNVEPNDVLFIFRENRKETPRKNILRQPIYRGRQKTSSRGLPIKNIFQRRPPPITFSNPLPPPRPLSSLDDQVDRPSSTKPDDVDSPRSPRTPVGSPVRVPVMSPGSPVRSSRIFGVDLNELVKDSELPPTLMRLLASLAEHGPHTEGVFRKSANYRKCHLATEQIDAGGQELDFNELSPILLAALLKSMLRSLPNCLLMCQLYDQWLDAVQLTPISHTIGEIRRLVEKLPQSHQTLLRPVICVLHRTSQLSDVNGMTPQSLSICIGPSLLWPLPSLPSLSLPAVDLTSPMVARAQEDVTRANRVVEILIEYAEQIFGSDCLELFGTIPAVLNTLVGCRVMKDEGRSTDSESLLSLGGSSDNIVGAGDNAGLDSEPALLHHSLQHDSFQDLAALDSRHISARHTTKSDDDELSRTDDSRYPSPILGRTFIKRSNVEHSSYRMRLSRLSEHLTPKKRRRKSRSEEDLRVSVKHVDLFARIPLLFGNRAVKKESGMTCDVDNSDSVKVASSTVDCEVVFDDVCDTRQEYGTSVLDSTLETSIDLSRETGVDSCKEIDSHNVSNNSRQEHRTSDSTRENDVDLHNVIDNNSSKKSLTNEFENGADINLIIESPGVPDAQTNSSQPALLEGTLPDPMTSPTPPHTAASSYDSGVMSYYVTTSDDMEDSVNSLQDGRRESYENEKGWRITRIDAGGRIPILRRSEEQSSLDSTTTVSSDSETGGGNVSRALVATSFDFNNDSFSTSPPIGTQESLISPPVRTQESLTAPPMRREKLLTTSSPVNMSLSRDLSFQGSMTSAHNTLTAHSKEIDNYAENCHQVQEPPASTNDSRPVRSCGISDSADNLAAHENILLPNQQLSINLIPVFDESNNLLSAQDNPVDNKLGAVQATFTLNTINDDDVSNNSFTAENSSKPLKGQPNFESPADLPQQPNTYKPLNHDDDLDARITSVLREKRGMTSRGADVFPTPRSLTRHAVVKTLSVVDGEIDLDLGPKPPRIKSHTIERSHGIPDLESFSRDIKVSLPHARIAKATSENNLCSTAISLKTNDGVDAVRKDGGQLGRQVRSGSVPNVPPPTYKEALLHKALWSAGLGELGGLPKKSAAVELSTKSLRRYDSDQFAAAARALDLRMLSVRLKNYNVPISEPVLNESNMTGDGVKNLGNVTSAINRDSMDKDTFVAATSFRSAAPGLSLPVTRPIPVSRSPPSYEQALRQFRPSTTSTTSSPRQAETTEINCGISSDALAFNNQKEAAIATPPTNEQQNKLKTATALDLNRSVLRNVSVVSTVNVTVTPPAPKSKLKIVTSSSGSDDRCSSDDMNNKVNKDTSATGVGTGKRKVLHKRSNARMRQRFSDPRLSSVTSLITSEQRGCCTTTSSASTLARSKSDSSAATRRYVRKKRQNLQRTDHDDKDDSENVDLSAAAAAQTDITAAQAGIVAVRSNSLAGAETAVNGKHKGDVIANLLADPVKLEQLNIEQVLKDTVTHLSPLSSPVLSSLPSIGCHLPPSLPSSLPPSLPSFLSSSMPYSIPRSTAHRTDSDSSTSASESIEQELASLRNQTDPRSESPDRKPSAVTVKDRDWHKELAQQYANQSLPVSQQIDKSRPVDQQVNHSAYQRHVDTNGAKKVFSENRIIKPPELLNNSGGKHSCVSASPVKTGLILKYNKEGASDTTGGLNWLRPAHHVDEFCSRTAESSSESEPNSVRRLRGDALLKDGVSWSVAKLRECYSDEVQSDGGGRIVQRAGTLGSQRAGTLGSQHAEALGLQGKHGSLDRSQKLVTTFKQTQ